MDEKSNNQKLIGTESTNQKQVEMKSSNQKPIGTESTNQKQVEKKSSNQKPVETKPTNQKSIRTESTDQKPVETKSTTGGEDINQSEANTDEINQSEGVEYEINQQKGVKRMTTKTKISRRNDEVTRRVTLIVAVYSICSSMATVFMLLQNAGKVFGWNKDLLSRFSFLGLAANSCWNPVIYVVGDRVFRRKLKRLFCFCVVKVNRENTSNLRKR